MDMFRFWLVAAAALTFLLMLAIFRWVLGLWLPVAIFLAVIAVLVIAVSIFFWLLSKADFG